MREVILRDHIDNLGRRGDVVSVAAGYARNYLLPQKLALPVTAANRRQVERERVVVEAREADERGQAERVAERVAAVECIVIPRRVGETGILYGSVTSADIADHLATQGIELDKRTIPAPRAAQGAGGVLRDGQAAPGRRHGAEGPGDQGRDRRADGRGRGSGAVARGAAGGVAGRAE